MRAGTLKGTLALAAVLAWGSTALAQPEALLTPAVTIPASHWLQWQMRHWYPAQAQAYGQAVTALGQSLDTHCQGESVVPVRQAWRDVLDAWGRLSIVGASPLAEAGFLPPVVGQAPSPEQLERAIAAFRQGTPDLAALDPAVRGLPALEWLLWSPPVGAVRADAAPASGGATPRAAAARKAPSPNTRKAAPPARSRSAPSSRRAAWEEAASTRQARAGAPSPVARALDGVPALPTLPSVPGLLSALALRWIGGTLEPVLQPLRQALSAGIPLLQAAPRATPRPTAKPAAKPAARGATASRKRGAASAAPSRPALPSSVPLRASRTSDGAACRLAQALVGDLAQQSRVLQSRFSVSQPPDVENNLPAPQVLGRWQRGLAQVQGQTQALANAEPVGRQRLRPQAGWVLSGSGASERLARWSALRDLAVANPPAAQDLDPGAPTSLEAWLRQRGQLATADRLHLTVLAVDRAMQAANLDGTPELQQAARALGVLQHLVDHEVSPALGFAPIPEGGLPAAPAASSVLVPMPMPQPPAASASAAAAPASAPASAPPSGLR